MPSRVLSQKPNISAPTRRAVRRSPLQLRPQLGQALLQLGLESRLVQLVQLAEIRSVGQVHGV